MRTRRIMVRKPRVRRFAVTGWLLGSLALAALPSPAAAHARYIVKVFGGGMKGEEPGLRASAYINREHAGVMKFTLFKRANGNWVPVKTKRGTKSEVSPVSYSANFNSPNANQCKFRAKFTTPEHRASSKSTAAFDCDGT